MPNNNHNKHYVTCHITGKRLYNSDAVPAATIRHGIKDLIKKSYPDFNDTCYISRDEMKRFRQEYIETVIKKDQGELTRLDKEVVNSIVEHDTLVKRIDLDAEIETSFANRMSDRIAEFGGSWGFIIVFLISVTIWMIVNTWLIFTDHFDPYPYIFLNLVLGVISAIQAPIIMMSQNRREDKDRKRAENDYKVNLKSELEIRHLHEKLDNLTQHQWKRLLEIQELQLELNEEKNEEIRERTKRKQKRKR